MNLEFAQNPAYRRFEQNMRELHGLIAAGEGDGDPADALRDAMSDDYRTLSANEVDRLNGLSEDLYSLAEPISVASEDRSPTDTHLAQAILRARQRDDWATVLSLLRPLAHHFPASSLAFQRYQAYARLGHPETAYLFLRRASELDPMDFKKQHVLLDFSRRAGREAEALSQAEGLLQDPSTPAPLLIAAAHIRFDALRNVSTEAALPVIRSMAVTLEHAMPDVKTLNGIPPSIAILGYTTLGFCREKLGDLDGAMTAFDQAVALDPRSDALRIARGLVLIPHDMDRAAVEFEVAAQLGSRLFHPYRFLAPYALGQGRWTEASEYANRLLAYTQDPTIAAEAQHWRAIAEFELGTSWPTVEALFREAKRLDPFNLRIEENFVRCQEARYSPTNQHPNIEWSRLGPDDFPNVSAVWQLAAAA